MKKVVYCQVRHRLSHLLNAAAVVVVVVVVACQDDAQELDERKQIGSQTRCFLSEFPEPSKDQFLEENNCHIS